MARRHPTTVLLTSVVIGVGLAAGLSGCSGDRSDRPTASADPTRSATATATASATPTTLPSGSPSTGTGASSPADDPTGSADDGTGPGSGNGSGVENPTSVDWATVTQQGIAAAGGGAVVSLAGSGDNWTVVVVNGPGGSETQSVVSATLGRVTSGPFPKAVDTATGAADLARAGAATTTASAAAAAAERAVSGSKLASLVLGGPASAPVWTATVTGGSSTTVTIDGRTGAATVS